LSRLKSYNRYYGIREVFDSQIRNLSFTADIENVVNLC